MTFIACVSKSIAINGQMAVINVSYGCQQAIGSSPHRIVICIDEKCRHASIKVLDAYVDLERCLVTKYGTSLG